MAIGFQHHQGLMVDEMERAVEFYLKAFEGRLLTSPVILEGHAAEMVMDAPPGTRYAMCLVGIGSGAVELFSFLGSERPVWAERRSGRLPHFGLQVDDVDGTLERVERAGGRRLFDRVERWGRAQVVYAADPDENVIELLDSPLQTIVDECRRMFPDAAPRGSQPGGGADA